MSWSEFAHEIASVSIGSAIISSEGTILVKHKNFNGTAAESSAWANLFADLSECRQRGISYGDKMMFVTEYNSSLIVGRRDQIVIVLVKGSKYMLAAVCDSTIGKHHHSSPDVI
jgi:hypothetical protein